MLSPTNFTWSTLKYFVPNDRLIGGSIVNILKSKVLRKGERHAVNTTTKKKYVKKSVDTLDINKPVYKRNQKA